MEWNAMSVGKVGFNSRYNRVLNDGMYVTKMTRKGWNNIDKRVHKKVQS